MTVVEAIDLVGPERVPDENTPISERLACRTITTR